MTRAASPATTPRAARALGADCASRRASARSTGGCIPHGSGLLLRRPGMCPSPVCWGLGGLASPEWEGTHRILPPLPPRQRLRLHAPQRRLDHGPERVDAGAMYRMARSHRVLHDGTERIAASTRCGRPHGASARRGLARKFTGSRPSAPVDARARSRRAACAGHFSHASRGASTSRASHGAVARWSYRFRNPHQTLRYSWAANLPSLR